MLQRSVSPFDLVIIFIAAKVDGFLLKDCICATGKAASDDE